VVPVDFSACSLKGLAYAKQLAKQFGATLVLLHCLPPQYYMASEEYARYDLPLLLGQIEKAARGQLDELAEEIEREGITVERDLEMGHPGQQICEEARDREADLIVTATHGNTGLKHVFLGSTAEYVVRHAVCSVLVVPTRERPLLM
jgi:nucleotide-binding universal stress UspA family protein